MSAEIRTETAGTLSMAHVEDGAHVETGDKICEIELMKTFLPLVAPCAGVVRFRVALGEIVGAGDVIALIE